MTSCFPHPARKRAARASRRSPRPRRRNGETSSSGIDKVHLRPYRSGHLARNAHILLFTPSCPQMPTAEEGMACTAPGQSRVPHERERAVDVCPRRVSRRDRASVRPRRRCLRRPASTTSSFWRRREHACRSTRRCRVFRQRPRTRRTTGQRQREPSTTRQERSRDGWRRRAGLWLLGYVPRALGPPRADGYYRAARRAGDGRCAVALGCGRRQRTPYTRRITPVGGRAMMLVCVHIWTRTLGVGRGFLGRVVVHVVPPRTCVAVLRSHSHSQLALALARVFWVYAVCTVCCTCSTGGHGPWSMGRETGRWDRDRDGGGGTHAFEQAWKYINVL